MRLYLLLIFVILYLIIDCIKIDQDPDQIENFSVKMSKDSVKPSKKVKKIKSSPQESETVKSKKKERKVEDPGDVKIIIKKTNKYKLIFKKEGLYVWEPIPLENYFPLGQIVTTENKKPEMLSILVKFNKENKPIDYTLKTMIDKKYGVWVPIGNDSIHFLSYIISKNKPSLNRIQGIHSKFTEETELEELIQETSVKLNANEIKTQFWKIHKSQFFTTNDTETHYYLPESNLRPNKLLNVKTTTKYTKIWSNKKNTKTVTIWRPIPDEDYRMLGDIILNNNIDPNNIIETPTIHKSNCKNVLYYNPKPLCYKNKDTDVCFWKPITHDGYTTTGDLITTDKLEPSNEMVSSIPLEYVEENNHIVNHWSNNKINLWSNEYSLFASTKYTKPSGSTYKLSNTHMDYEKDPLDTESTVIIEYIPKNINSHTKLEEKIKLTLSNKLDIEQTRIKINSIDKINNKITLTIKEKRNNSIEEKTEKVINDLVEIIYKNKIKIHDKTNILILLENISVNSQKETIALDNTLFNDFVNEA